MSGDGKTTKYHSSLDYSKFKTGVVTKIYGDGDMAYPRRLVRYMYVYISNAFIKKKKRDEQRNGAISLNQITQVSGHPGKNNKALVHLKLCDYSNLDATILEDTPTTSFKNLNNEATTSPIVSTGVLKNFTKFLHLLCVASQCPT